MTIPARFLLFLMLIALIVNACNNPSKEWNETIRQGPYAGSTAPGDNPELFAQGFITTGIYERDVAISNDGNEIYFSVFLGDWATIMVSRNTSNNWTVPEVASFARDTAVKFCEPAFTPDGQHLLFLCTLPLDGGEPKPGWQDQNIWMVSRDENGMWNDRKPLPPVVNEGAQFFPSIAANGDFYFCRTDTTSMISRIYRTTWPVESGTIPEQLPSPINGTGTIFNACISPDGSCLVACVSGRDSIVPLNHPVYYVFFKDGDQWTDGINLDATLQMKGSNAISPSFSPDGKYFFFATNRKRNETAFSNGDMNLDFFQERRNTPGNGNSDIYWVDARVIFNLKN